MKEEFEKYIKEIIDKYIPILFLQKFTFRISNNIECKDAMAECKIIYPYLNAEIRYNEEKFKSNWEDKEYINSIIVHELCHLITDPFYSKANQKFVGRQEIEDERENLTDYICNIVLKNIN